MSTSGLFASMTALEWCVAGLYFPSAIAKKFVSDAALQPLFPTLPKWSWMAVGFWETISAGLILFAPPGSWLKELGLVMFYMYKGGVLYAILGLPNDQGHTHGSGNGALGLAGVGFLIPCFAGLYMGRQLDTVFPTMTAPMGCMLGGALIGYGIHKSHWLDAPKEKKKD